MRDMLPEHRPWYLFSAIGFVALAFLFLAPVSVSAASLAFSPAATTVAVGDIFTVAVDVTSPAQAMNAVSGDVSFPSDKLRVLGVSNSGSVMNLWVQNPSFSNAAGAGDINFAGVVLNPGFIGTAGNVVTIRFQALAPGNAPLSFSDGSILANDGNGTNILSSLGAANIAITQAAPAQGSAANDTVPPLPFSITEVTTDMTDPQPVFSWSTTDGQSGVAKYLVQIGGGDPFNASMIAVPGKPGEYKLPLQAPNENIPLTVDAYDNAGNIMKATTTFSIAPLTAPSITDYSRQLVSGTQLLVVAGTSTPGETVQLFLAKGNQVFAFSAPVNQDGNWAIAVKVNIGSGIWDLKAQATDARGAVSSFTPTYEISVGGWLTQAVQFLLAWGFLILLALLVLAVIAALAYYVINRLRRFHVSLSRRLIQERKELRDDLKRIEKELGSDGLHSRADLDKEIKHIEEDLERDVNKKDE